MEGQAPRFTQGGSPARPRMRAATDPPVNDSGDVDHRHEDSSDSESPSDDDSSDSGSDEEDGDAETSKVRIEPLLSGATEFENGKAVADALRQHAVANAFKITSVKGGGGGSSRKYTCGSAPACGVFFNTRKLSTGKWHVSKSYTEHTNCTAFAVPGARTIAQLKLFISLIESSRNASAKDMAAVVQVSI
jgi:hypothetical protein